MKILRLKIENYRGVTLREVTFDPCGVTVIEGDNEVGKTSMAEAIDLLFDYLDSSKDRRVTQVKPVGRDVGSLVEIEVQTGRYEFTYRKQFNRRSSTELRVTSPALEQLDGREAHERVEQILHETMDVALWKALRLQQGVKIDQADLSSQTSLQKALDTVSATALGGEREGNLFDRVASEYQKYWSPRTSKPLPRATELIKQSTAAEATVSRWEADLAGLADTVERCARLKQDVGVEAAELASRKTDLSALRSQWLTLQESAQIVAGLATKLEAATAGAAAADAKLNERRSLVGRESTARRHLDQAVSDVERETPALELRKKLLEQAIAHAAATDTTLSAAQNTWMTANQDLEHLGDASTVDRATEQLARYTRAKGSAADAKAAADQIKVTKRGLASIEESHLAWRQAIARCQQDLPTVRLAGDGQTIHLNGHDLTLGLDPYELPVAEMVHLEIAGVQIEIAAGGSAEALGRAEADALSRYEQDCAEFAVKDVTDGRAAISKRAAAEADLKHARTQQSDALGGKSVSELEEETTSAQTRIATYGTVRTTEAPIPVDSAAARNQVKAAQRELAVAESAQTAARTDVEETRGKRDRARDAVTAANTLREAATQQMATTAEELQTARMLTSDDELERRVSEAQSTLKDQATEHRKADDGYRAQDPESLKVALDNVEQVVADCTANLDNDRHRLVELQTELDVRGESGVASQLDVARSAATHIERELTAYTARAATAKLLYATMAAARTNAQRAYVGPLRDKIESLGRLVFGPTLGIELTDDLRIDARTLNGQRLGFANLSGGAREQLSVISRLACACLVSPFGGVPVILDDALGYSDPGRLAAMGAVLALAGRTCQVLVLTCMPARYRAVGSAVVVQFGADTRPAALTA